MNPLLGWLLAAAALSVGYLSAGGPGLVLALSVVVFWLLLQFSRTLRVMRRAAERPLGTVDNAVMLNARLRTGMTLLQIVALTRSLGEKVGDTPESWRWHDDAGDAVCVEMHNGRVRGVRLERAALTRSDTHHAEQPGQHQQIGGGLGHDRDRWQEE